MEQYSCVKEEMTPLSSTSDTSCHLPYKPQAAAMFHRGVNSSTANRLPEELMTSGNADVPHSPPLMFAPNLPVSPQNSSFGGSWSRNDTALPPLPPFCLPFHRNYSNRLDPLMSALPPPPPGILPMQTLLAHYAHLPSFLTGLFPPLVPLTTARTQLADVGVELASDGGSAVGVAGRVEGRRVSCDSSVSCGVMMNSDKTSSPRVVSSTSDDLDSDDRAPVDLAHVTGSSLPIIAVISVAQQVYY